MTRLYYEARQDAARGTGAKPSPEIEGKSQRAASARSRKEAMVPPTVGQSDVVSGLEYDFRVWGIKGTGKPFRLDYMLESLTWDDTETIMRGSCSIRRQEHTKRALLREGDRVRLEYAKKGSTAFQSWWTMRVQRPALTYRDGQETYQLANDLDRLQRSIDDFLYKANKKHPGGWRADEIIADICKRYRVPFVCTLTSHKIKTFGPQTATSPMDVINQVLDIERKHTGQRFVCWYERGILFLTPRKKNKDLVKLAGAVIEASINTYLSERFATVVTVRRQTESAVAGTAGGTGDGSVASVIAENAPKYGLDPAAVLAYALEESGGRRDAVGDNGTSFGPFQMHIGGALPPGQTAEWAGSDAGLIYGMQQMGKTPARGKTGIPAVDAIYQYFGKGDPAATPKGEAMYPEAQRQIAAAQGNTGKDTKGHKRASHGKETGTATTSDPKPSSSPGIPGVPEK